MNPKIIKILMKKKSLLMMAVAFLSAAAGAQTIEHSPYVPEGYELDWNDEFNGNSQTLSSDWTHEVKNSGWVNNERQNYVNGVVEGKRVTEIVDGVLHINCFLSPSGVKETTGPNKGNTKVYSGRIYAHVNTGWTYGYIEARIKLPKGKGTWPAFWMMPVNFHSWPADGEIDIMEEVGVNPNYVSSSLHATDHVHSNNTQVTHEMYCAGAEDNFHIYAIEWTARNITTYVDGKVQLSYDNTGKGRSDWPYEDPFYIILNLAWGGDWGGWNGVNEAALPTTMEVDYVRVYQKEPEVYTYTLGDQQMNETFSGSYKYTADVQLTQGQTFSIKRDGKELEGNWYVDADFLKNKGNGNFELLAVDGEYVITADDIRRSVMVTPMKNGKPATFDTTNGTGTLWVIGANSCYGKPNFASGTDYGWDEARALPMAEIAPHQFKISFVAGTEINPAMVNFKFFHQNSYGNDSSDEYNATGTYKLTTTSDLFGVGTGSDDHDNGNIYLREGKSLTAGERYAFIIDATNPANATLTAGKASDVTAISSPSLSNAAPHYYTLQGHEVQQPAAKGVYIVKNGQESHKVVVK